MFRVGKSSKCHSSGQNIGQIAIITDSMHMHLAGVLSPPLPIAVPFVHENCVGIFPDVLEM